MTKEDVSNVLQYLKSKGIKKGDVADKMVISAGYLSDIIGGRKPVTQEFLNGFKKDFGNYIDEYYLLQDEKDEKSENKNSVMQRGKKKNEGINNSDKLDRILDGNLRLINAMADHAEAALLRERNYANLIRENKTYASMANPSVDDSVSKKSIDEARYMAALQLIDLIEQGKKGPEFDEALEDLRKRVVQEQ